VSELRDAWVDRQMGDSAASPGPDVLACVPVVPVLLKASSTKPLLLSLPPVLRDQRGAAKVYGARSLAAVPFLLGLPWPWDHTSGAWSEKMEVRMA
jgi:hypothetical protein